VGEKERHILTVHPWRYVGQNLPTESSEHATEFLPPAVVILL
jgi:hypothetical protein